MYNIYNKETDLVIKNTVLCDSFSLKLRGYMFYKKPPFDSLILLNEKAIHMFFCFFKLAIIVLDKEHEIIDKFVIAPWRISKYYFKAQMILESPDLSILDKVSVGDKLDLIKIS